jgi:DNA-directed RNA polymerase subunit RPC12/RpoP
MIWTIIIFTAIFLVIVISFRIARKRELRCPKCNSNRTEKSGKRREIERSRRALIAGPQPYHDYEYICKDCGHTFWSTIESIWAK